MGSCSERRAGPRASAQHHTILSLSLSAFIVGAASVLASSDGAGEYLLKAQGQRAQVSKRIVRQPGCFNGHFEVIEYTSVPLKTHLGNIMTIDL